MNGTLRERSPGRWQVRAYDVTQNKQVSRTVRGTKKQAQAELRKLVDKVESGIGVNRLTVSALSEQYMEHLTKLGRSPATLREYRRLLDTVVIPRLGKTELEKLTARDLDGFYLGLTGCTKMTHAMLRAMLHQAVRWQMVERNVADNATLPEVTHKVQAAPTSAQVGLLLRAAQDDPVLILAITLAVITGARRGELCALKWRNYDRAAATLTIQGALVVDEQGEVVPTRGKGNHDRPGRTVALGEVGCAFLDEARTSIIPEAPILTLDGVNHLHPNWLTKAFGALAEDCGVDAHFHSLRHLAASELVASGMDIVTVAKRLGHANPTMTLKVYSHVSPKNDEQAAQIMGRTIKPA